MSAPGDWFEPAAGAPQQASSLRGNAALRSQLAPETAAAAGEEREEPAAPEAAEEPKRRPPGRPRGSRNRPRDFEPSEAEVERSQEAIAAVPGEEIEETQPTAPSVLVPFDPGASVQGWFGGARTRLREMEGARLPPDRYTAFRKANFAPLTRLHREFFSYWQVLDEIITAGEQRQ
jgi:hypothetical protein